MTSIAHELMKRRIARGTARERFVGVEPAEIDALERDLGVALPGVYRDYLALMGREPGGRAQSFDIRFGCLRAITSELKTAAAAAKADLGGDVAAIFANQGVDYLYLRGEETRDDPDPPVHRLKLTRGGDDEGFASVSAYLRALLVEGADIFM